MGDYVFCANVALDQFLSSQAKNLAQRPVASWVIG